MKREREPPRAAARPPNVLMLGTGEYTTGFVGTGAADSDKGTGVVALVMLDLQRRGKVGRLGMCGTNGKKLPQIRAHMQRVLGDVYTGIDPSMVETWPADDVVDPKACKRTTIRTWDAFLCRSADPVFALRSVRPRGVRGLRAGRRGDHLHAGRHALCDRCGVPLARCARPAATSHPAHTALPEPRPERGPREVSERVVQKRSEKGRRKVRERSERGPPGASETRHVRTPWPRACRHACAGDEATRQDAAGAQRADRARAAGGLTLPLT